MAWTQPAANALSAATYIKDTDDKLQSTMDDLEAYVNSAAPYVGAGLAEDATTLVNVGNTQTITGAKTFSSTITASGGVTGNVNGNATTATNLTGLTTTVAELNQLDGIPATLTATEIGYLEGVTSSIQTQLNNIVISGSNANGNYIKYADGTMICFRGALSGIFTGTLSNFFGLTSGGSNLTDDTYTFPIAFVGTAPVVMLTSESFYIQGVWVVATTLTTTRVQSSYRAGGSPIYNYLAIGKWK